MRQRESSTSSSDGVISPESEPRPGPPIAAYVAKRNHVQLYLRNHPEAAKLNTIEVLWRNNLYMGFANSERGKRYMAIFEKYYPPLLTSGEVAKIYQKWEVELPELIPEK